MLSKKSELRLPVIEDWGLIDYQTACDKQSQYVQEIIRGERGETLVFCSHNPVVTRGRGTQDGDIFSWQGNTVDVNRGGRATYHGPSQVVMYPMICIDDKALSYIQKKIKVKDLHDYMRALEQSAIMTVRDYEVEAKGHIKKTTDPIKVKLVKPLVCGSGNKKLASIGIAVKKWVTSHGLAINLFEDEKAFTGIHPCGFSTETMISLKQLTKKRLIRETFQKELASNFIYSIYLGH